ncbi:ATP-binding protein [Aquisalimonas asiatica]|uniref:histidine kinase n=1 Tax=Aquisalimonas asiatica TaxID=406100 RepID=A0A1H8PY39_9GAMM|nr:ATP-binding protein [Aquisalimonas asiatica]SEO46840.1 Histidine kinase-, DNA gyrase B-, and HSP90-like ATPase [Aquisalimonas asiatica]
MTDTDDADISRPTTRITKVTFPWLSALGALLALAYLLAVNEPWLATYYDIPREWLRLDAAYGALGGFILLLLLDLRRYRRQYAGQKADLLHLNHQLDALWERKKQLQMKAHTYSGHADKLKLFISDKLLEYIEYDEKFLHFKSIAAEVRHNGVISFDKVQTALQHAAAANRAALDATGGDTPDAAARQAEYEAALDAMRYLWDLLDLSTADNLALHISNHLCECEEHYVQRELQGDHHAALPYEPAYLPQRAAWRALGAVRNETMPAPDDDTGYTLHDSKWTVHLEPAGELLGNENHLVLLLENLLKNAQFFANKRGFKKAFAPVALTLTEEHGHACLRVYNRGPHIRDEDRDNLFQLGYSTRRTNEHHGRGLGLYFVGEIVKGYEGRIDVHNIETPTARYTVRLELDDGEVITETLDTTTHDGEPDGAREWTFTSPLKSVEITPEDSDDTQRLDDFAASGKQRHFDPAHPERPHWRLDYAPRRKAHRVSIEPLNINGVEFEIRLPTAQHRLESSDVEPDEDIDTEVERLDEHFRTPMNQ